MIEFEAKEFKEFKEFKENKDNKENSSPKLGEVAEGRRSVFQKSKLGFTALL